MYLAKVVGNVWSTRKEEGLRGLKFLAVQPVGLELEPYGPIVIAADRIGAGEGEIVMVVGGSSARQGFEARNLPIDAVVVGIIDAETFQRN